MEMFLNTDVIEMERFLDQEILEMVDKSYDDGEIPQMDKPASPPHS